MKWQGRSQRADRERDDDREQVERNEPGRVRQTTSPAKSTSVGIIQRRARVSARAAPVAQRDQNEDKRRDPEEEVQAERRRAEQLVAEEPQEERRPE